MLPSGREAGAAIDARLELARQRQLARRLRVDVDDRQVVEGPQQSVRAESQAADQVMPALGPDLAFLLQVGPVLDDAPGDRHDRPSDHRDR